MATCFQVRRYGADGRCDSRLLALARAEAALLARVQYLARRIFAGKTGANNLSQQIEFPRIQLLAEFAPLNFRQHCRKRVSLIAQRYRRLRNGEQLLAIQRAIGCMNKKPFKNNN